MTSFYGKVAQFSSTIIKKYGAKVFTQICNAIRTHWTTIAKWVAESAVMEVVEKIVDKILNGTW